MPARTTLFLDNLLSSPLSRFTRTWWGGGLLAVGLVGLAIGLRLVLDDLVLTHYLLMAPAVIITALLATRSSVLVAIGLSVLADALLARRADWLELAVTALLFAVITLITSEIGRRLIEAVRHASSLARDLARREALLDAILTSAPVVTLDGMGRITRISQAAVALLGLEAGSAIGRPFVEFSPSFDLETARSPKPSDTGVFSVNTPHGESLPLAIRVADLPSDIGPERTVLTLADQRRTEGLHEQAQLFQGRLATAWRLNFMGEMAASLAHEINQPLTAATVYLHAGQAEIARTSPIADSARHTLDMAKGQLLRAGEILKRIRERIDSGARALSVEPAASILSDLGPLFSLITNDTGVVIRIEAKDPEVRVMADRIQVQQAIGNLVRNAVDAILVEDNGPGIPEDQIDHLFHPLKTSKTGGMGLGLSVTRSIVEGHEGVLVVDRSALG
ncbi:hypothetical protein LTR94_024448, partial [Friedmanniomyces endolithicus]